MAAGVPDRLSSLEDVIARIDTDIPPVNLVDLIKSGLPHPSLLKVHPGTVSTFY
jgi:hypothetical protein